MAKRQPSVLRMPENGAGDPFFGRQGNWFEVIFESSYDGIYITDGSAITLTLKATKRSAVCAKRKWWAAAWRSWWKAGLFRPPGRCWHWSAGSR